ncbi:MAG: SDR family oxidoreductase [Bryobacteraceae bacterium]
MNQKVHAGAGERVVLTGATGFLGQEIFRLLIERRPEARLVLLVRETADKSAAQRLEALLARCCAPEEREAVRRRIQVYAADTALECCGLSPGDWAAVADGATRIIHAAAAVRFDALIEETRRANVGGVRNVLELAGEARRRGSLGCFTHVSTAFVAGCRAGLVREDELNTGQRFRNAYEASKCEAETVVRERAGELPAVIVRPSIVVGHSRTGATTSFHMMYWPLKAYVERRWRIVPGSPRTPIDLVPVDFVAEATLHLAWDESAEGGTFHLCAGPGRSATIGEIAGAASRYFQLPAPRFVNPVLFLALLRPILEVTVWGKRRHVLKKGFFYRPYLDMRLEFDTTQADLRLSPAGIRPPNVMDYLDRLFAYCVESDWGRKPVAPRALE